MQLVRTLFKLKAISLQFEHQSVLKKSTIRKTFYTAYFMLVIKVVGVWRAQDIWFSCKFCNFKFNELKEIALHIGFYEVFLV